MGILDDAIKEHLELKRQHGVGDSELKQLEDEAFGAAERPGGERSVAESPSRPAPRAEIADLQEAPAMEHEAAVPTTEEREAIAEQPTEMYDLEEELGSPQAEAPSEEELVEEEMDEPRLAPVDPLSGLDEDVEKTEAVEDVEEDEDDDFWDEKRLSDELDQALEAPAEVEAEEELGFEDEPEEPETEEKSDAGQEEDVLEETPDFLEEAPEDDQLWFEQKPPKDFDFDD